MAYPADITPDISDRPSRGTTNTQQLNNLITDVRALRDAMATLATKLNADAGVTDTNYVVPADTTFVAAKIHRA